MVAAFIGAAGLVDLVAHQPDRHNFASEADQLLTSIGNNCPRIVNGGKAGRPV